VDLSDTERDGWRLANGVMQFVVAKKVRARINRNLVAKRVRARINRNLVAKRVRARINRNLVEKVESAGWYPRLANKGASAKICGAGMEMVEDAVGGLRR
jgi:hypothetical protein